jgi:hypothetical protein
MLDGNSRAKAVVIPPAALDEPSFFAEIYPRAGQQLVSGLDTPMRPLYVAYGRTELDDQNFYIYPGPRIEFLSDRSIAWNSRELLRRVHPCCGAAHEQVIDRVHSDRPEARTGYAISAINSRRAPSRPIAKLSDH